METLETFPCSRPTVGDPDRQGPIAASGLWVVADLAEMKNCQQYLAKNPNGYRCQSATGARVPR